MAKQSVFRGDRMREARQARKMTQTDLSKRVGVTRAQIANLELGTGEPSLATLTLVAYALDVSADWLLDLSEALTAITPYSSDPIPFID